MAKKENAIKLFVFIDTSTYQSEKPRLVIISRFKRVGDLRKEFSENQNYSLDEQNWVINNYCYPDEKEIADIIEDMEPFRQGYISYLFITTKEEKYKIPGFFDLYLEKLYSSVDPHDRWHDPDGDPIIIADTVDSSKPLPVVGWPCDDCTFINKYYKEWCEVCNNSRPANFQIPKFYVLTEDDNIQIQKIQKEKEKERKIEEDRQIQLEKERMASRKRIEELYKNQIAYTTEDCECPICGGDFEAGDAVILRSCHHTVCKDCLKGYLTTADDPRVKCPTENCIGVIEDGEISGILTEEEYKMYEQLNLRTAESKTANTLHCMTPNCTAWVIYDDSLNFFDCPICTKKNCLLCAAIHDNQTCQEYQDELKLKAKGDEWARKDLEFMENMIKIGEAMKCPGCKFIVQKKSGCDWIQCNMCKVEICWATKGFRWGPQGRGDMSGGCKCNYVTKRCHPQCGNCH